MPDGDGAAVDVDLVGVPAEVLVDGAGLRRERLVGLDQVEIADAPAGLLERRARGRDRPGAHDRGIDAGMRPGHDARERRLAALGGFARRHQHHRGGAVVDARGIGGGDGAFLVEGRTQLGNRLHGDARLRILVGVDHHVALARLDRHSCDLVLEPARLHGGLGLVLRLDRELVLLRAGDLPFLGDVLGSGTHVVAVEGVPEAVLDHGVDELDAAHLHALAQMLAVRRHAHGFLAAGDHDLGIAVEDRLVAERDRAQAGPAELVDAPGRALDRDAGGDRGLPRRVLALAGGEDLAEDHLGDLAALDAGALERFLDRDLAQLMGHQVGKGPVEGPDRCAGRADDDDIVLHLVAPSVSGWTATEPHLPAVDELLATPAWRAGDPSSLVRSIWDAVTGLSIAGMADMSALIHRKEPKKAVQWPPRPWPDAQAVINRWPASKETGYAAHGMGVNQAEPT